MKSPVSLPSTVRDDLSLLICGILTIYNSFRCFREAYLIGGSHPNEQLYSIQHFLQNNFMNMNYARLEAASILVVIFVEAFVNTVSIM